MALIETQDLSWGIFTQRGKGVQLTQAGTDAVLHMLCCRVLWVERGVAAAW